ncbi:hypothetical protein D3C75_592940 [compost metagenome]
MNNERFSLKEVMDSGLPYYVTRSGNWLGNKYPFAVLLSKTRCKELGVPILPEGREKPSAFLYVPLLGRGTKDNSKRYVGLYDRTDAYDEIKDRLHPREIMGTRPDAAEATE